MMLLDAYESRRSNRDSFVQEGRLLAGLYSRDHKELGFKASISTPADLIKLLGSDRVVLPDPTAVEARRYPFLASGWVSCLDLNIVTEYLSALQVIVDTNGGNSDPDPIEKSLQNSLIYIATVTYGF